MKHFLHFSDLSGRWDLGQRVTYGRQNYRIIGIETRGPVDRITVERE